LSQAEFPEGHYWELLAAGLLLFLRLNEKCQNTGSKAILQLLRKQWPVYEKNILCYSKIHWSRK